MYFKKWLVESKDFSYYRNILLGKLNLDQTHGLTQSLNTWEPDRLISMLNSLGEFKELPQKIQQQVEGQIRSGVGTLEDLVKMMTMGATSDEQNFAL